MSNNKLYIDPISDADFRRQVIDILLGTDWYVVDSLSQKQVNSIALDEIKRKYCCNSVLRKLLRSKPLRYVVFFFICTIGFILSETLIGYGVIRFVISTWCFILMLIFTGVVVIYAISES